MRSGRGDSAPPATATLVARPGVKERFEPYLGLKHDGLRAVRADRAEIAKTEDAAMTMELFRKSSSGCDPHGSHFISWLLDSDMMRHDLCVPRRPTP